VSGSRVTSHRRVRRRPRRRPRASDSDVFVDAFLNHFAERHPSIAAGSGLHMFDDRLEDFSAAGVAAEVEAWKG